MKKDKYDVYSPMKGKVKYTLKTKSDYGNRLYIDFGKCIMMFAHLSIFYVKEGQEVEAGELIGEMGETGYSEGIHLHISAFSKYTKTLTAKDATDPTYFLQLADYYPTNTKVSNPYGSKYCNPKLKKHEGIDMGTKLILGWEDTKINPLTQDYLVKEKHPEFFKEH